MLIQQHNVGACAILKEEAAACVMLQQLFQRISDLLVALRALRPTVYAAARGAAKPTKTQPRKDFQASLLYPNQYARTVSQAIQLGRQPKYCLVLSDSPPQGRRRSGRSM
jgi:hypothetical protein